MSGPLRVDDIADIEERPAPTPGVEITPSRVAQVGRATVHRTLPTRLRRTVGAWCFVDHAPPAEASGDGGMQIGPHPHIGLQTVTWLLAGEVVHRDSLGSDQAIRPGQLNLMTAGRAVAHAEETPPTFRGQLHAVQLWVAQPDATRNAAPAFEHHDELPQVGLGSATATVLVGTLAGTTSPARRDSDHLGVDLVLRPGSATVPVDPAHEHALVVLDGRVAAAGQDIAPDVLAYLAPGRDAIAVTTTVDTRALLLGGAPFEARPFMWWNFVARTPDEIDEAYRSWQAGDDRFAPVASTLPIIPAPPPPWWTGAAAPFRR